MTGGSVVVLGKVGANFGAGMSGGFAFVLDDIEHLKTTYNNEMVELSVLDKNNTEACSWLKQEIEEYCRKIDSDFAKEILQNFDKNIQNFVQITPIGKDIKDLIKNNTR
jgi:glutamate synthase (NADPH/NADH) large chain